MKLLSHYSTNSASVDTSQLGDTTSPEACGLARDLREVAPVLGTVKLQMHLILHTIVGMVIGPFIVAGHESAVMAHVVYHDNLQDKH